MNSLGSTSPFIKPEEDFQDTHNPMASFNPNYGHGSWPATNNQSNNYDFLSNSGSLRPPFGFSNVIDDDELEVGIDDIIDFEQGGDAQVQSPQLSINQYSTSHNGPQAMNAYSMSMPAPSRNQQNYVNPDIYSSTPPGNPAMHSNFAQSYDQSNMNHLIRIQQQQQNQFRQSQSSLGPQSPNGNGYRGPHSLGSTSMSPLARSVAMGGRKFGSTDASSHAGSQAVPDMRQRAAAQQSQWESRFGGISFDSEPGDDTPLTSPMSVPQNGKQLSAIMENEKSPPLRVKAHGLKAASVPTGVTKEEQKKAKRRNAHNVVEQKRRDKINDRIQELSRLVPAHRLEDNKIKKQLASSARGGTGMSPPLNPLRKTSTISQTMSVDDRDKTKGNSLDGAVAWTRDLMWMLYRKLEQESILHETIHEMGGQVPYQEREDERRMRSELMSALESSGADCFEYSRGHGSGLWVPDHTDQAGNPLQPSNAPDFFDFQQSHEGNLGVQEDPTWNYTPESGRDSLDFKDQDDFTMEMS